MRIADFEWDEGNVTHLALEHGIEPEEAEEVLAVSPLVRKTKRGHFAAFGAAMSGRLLVIIFDYLGHERARVITGWDMNHAERKYFNRQTGRR